MKITVIGLRMTLIGVCMNILIVDDEILEVQIIQKMINREAFTIEEIYTAYSMKQAMEILAEKKISILLSDIEMPKGSGHDLIEWVRKQNIPVVSIFLTSHAQFTYAREAIRLGVSGYILKPVIKSDLEESLTAAIELMNKMKPKESETVEEDIPGIIKEVKKYIEKNMNSELSRNDLAAMVFLHPDYLSHIFKEKVGISISDYIIKIRMQKAEQLLLNTKEQISEIAAKTGYANTGYFSKLFKRETKLTPKEYRKNGGKVD